MAQTTLTDSLPVADAPFLVQLRADLDPLGPVSVVLVFSPETDATRVPSQQALRLGDVCKRFTERLGKAPSTPAVRDAASALARSALHGKYAAASSKVISRDGRIGEGVADGTGLVAPTGAVRSLYFARVADLNRDLTLHEEDKKGIIECDLWTSGMYEHFFTWVRTSETPVYVIARVYHFQEMKLIPFSLLRPPDTFRDHFEKAFDNLNTSAVNIANASRALAVFKNWGTRRSDSQMKAHSEEMQTKWNQLLEKLSERRKSLFPSEENKAFEKHMLYYAVCANIEMRLRLGQSDMREMNDLEKLFEEGAVDADQHNLIYKFLGNQITGNYCHANVKRVYDKECIICLEDMKTNCTLACGHNFHTWCLLKYVTGNNMEVSGALRCPICKAPIVAVPKSW